MHRLICCMGTSSSAAAQLPEKLRRPQALGYFPAVLDWADTGFACVTVILTWQHQAWAWKCMLATFTCVHLHSCAAASCREMCQLYASAPEVLLQAVHINPVALSAIFLQHCHCLALLKNLIGCN